MKVELIETHGDKVMVLHSGYVNPYHGRAYEGPYSDPKVAVMVRSLIENGQIVLAASDYRYQRFVDFRPINGGRLQRRTETI